MNAHNYKHPIIFIHFLNKLDTAGMIILLFIIITNFKVAFYQKKKFQGGFSFDFQIQGFWCKVATSKAEPFKKAFLDK